MKRAVLIFIVILIKTVNIYCQDIYYVRLQIIPFYLTFPIIVQPESIKRNSEVKITIKNSPWGFEFKDFIDSIKYYQAIDQDTADPMLFRDFRIRMVIIHKYFFWKRYVIYCDKFDTFSYKGRRFENEFLMRFVHELIPPAIYF